MTERWRSLPGYEGIYEVSDVGRVKSLPRINCRGRSVHGRMLSIWTHPSGHKQVKLCRDGNSVVARVHQLVLFAFVGPRPQDCEVLHGDGNPGNNRLSNLRWGTRSENLRDRVRHGVHHQAIKTHCPQAHPYDAVNTYVTSDGRRMCRTCLSDRCRQYRAEETAEHRDERLARRRAARRILREGKEAA